jgi:hypothetical protein
MQQARGGMGSHKHGVSGHTTKSPRMRLWERMEAEKQERKRRGIINPVTAVKDLFHPKRKR